MIRDMWQAPALEEANGAHDQFCEAWTTGSEGGRLPAQGMRVADGDADDGVEVRLRGPEDLAPTNELKLIPLVMERRKFADGQLMELHRQQDQGMTALAVYTSPTTVVQYPSALLGTLRTIHPALTPRAHNPAQSSNRTSTTCDSCIPIPQQSCHYSVS